jgi:hypothetical protein
MRRIALSYQTLHAIWGAKYDSASESNKNIEKTFRLRRDRIAFVRSVCYALALIKTARVIDFPDSSHFAAAALVRLPAFDEIIR